MSSTSLLDVHWSIFLHKTIWLLRNTENKIIRIQSVNRIGRVFLLMFEFCLNLRSLRKYFLLRKSPVLFCSPKVVSNRTITILYQQFLHYETSIFSSVCAVCYSSRPLRVVLTVTQGKNSIWWTTHPRDFLFKYSWCRPERNTEKSRRLNTQFVMCIHQKSFHIWVHQYCYPITSYLPL